MAMVLSYTTYYTYITYLGILAFYIGFEGGRFCF